MDELEASTTVSAVEAGTGTASEAGRGRSLLAALRPVQWTKNGLMVVPLLTGHAVGDLWRWGHLAVAVLAMCLVASATYLVNDLLDRAHDRDHPAKQHRPIAAGAVSPGLGLAATAALGVVGLTLAGLVDLWLLSVAGLYVVLTGSYSALLKRKLFADVLVLAALFTLRIIAGGLAVGLFPTDWLLACAMFLFLSLACVKRYSELQRLAAATEQQAQGRAYHTGDLPVLLVLGGASGYLAVMVVAMYIDTDLAQRLYARPGWLWLTCPVGLYWVSRLWLLTHRGTVGEDPLLFALKDRTSWACLACLVLIAMLAA
jgi:4-hydroxybenzoate polyprenyltransferase